MPLPAFRKFSLANVCTQALKHAKSLSETCEHRELPKTWLVTAPASRRPLDTPTVAELESLYEHNRTIRKQRIPKPHTRY